MPRFFVCFLALLATLLIFSVPWGAMPANAAQIEYGKKPLIIFPPSGFVDSRTISDALFQANKDHAGLDGVLLKIYLSDPMAQLYAEGRLDAVTRQVTLYGWQDAALPPLDKKNLEFAAQIVAGAYAACQIVPEADLRKADVMDATYRQAAETGVSLLVETELGENSITHVVLLNYPMRATLPPVAHPEAPKPGKGAPKKPTKSTPPPPAAEAAATTAAMTTPVITHLTTAMATSLVLVNENIVYITASSIVTDGSIADHIAWVTYASEAFADMLVSANKS